MHPIFSSLLWVSGPLLQWRRHHNTSFISPIHLNSHSLGGCWHVMACLGTQNALLMTLVSNLFIYFWFYFSQISRSVPAYLWWQPSGAWFNYLCDSSSRFHRTNANSKHNIHVLEWQDFHLFQLRSADMHFFSQNEANS